MQKILPFIHGSYYHIYNCGINGEALFRKPADYERFLQLYERYIEPVADTYAWCLMGNHFHLLVRVKEEGEILTFYQLQPLSGLKTTDRAAVSKTPSMVTDLDGGFDKKNDKWKTRKPVPSNQFSHLFNAYAQYFNTRCTRHGSLFERPFKRKLIDSERYFKQVIIYIHNNPVHHGFCSHPHEYRWSSYHTCISDKTTKLKRDTVLEWFDCKENFKASHYNTTAGNTDLEEFLEVETHSY